MKITYEVYVEGGLVDTGLTRKQAERMRSRYEAEGWNVRVLQVHVTVIGPLGVLV